MFGIGVQVGLGTQGTVFGVQVPTDPLTIFAANPPLDGDDINTSRTFFVVVTLNSEDPLDELRITIAPGSTGTLTVLGVGFAKFVAEGTALGPITEVKFSGASGFASKTTNQTSDWTDISGLGLQAGDRLAVSFTTGIAGQATTRYEDTAYVADTYHEAGTSWNDPTTTLNALTKLAGRNYAIAAIETRGLSGGGVTPPAENLIPMSFNDPMFSAMTNYGGLVVLTSGVNLSRLSCVSSGDASTITLKGNNTVEYCRVDSREAVRLESTGTINKCYLEATGIVELGDHADTVQVYSPGQVGGDLTIQNSQLVAHLTAATANFFCSDTWTGSITLQNVIINGGPYGARIDADNRNVSVSFEDVSFVGPFGTATHLIQDVGTGVYTITKWENVRNATIVNNELILGTLIPSPRDVTAVALSLASPSADAWCWFHEPRALSAGGKTWFGTTGSDDNSVLTGRASIYEIDEATDVVTNFELASGTTEATWGDDHDYPSMIQRPDGRLIAFYCPHRTGGAILYRVSVSPGTIADGWSQEYSLGNGANYPTYPSPVFLSAENNRLYLFYRNGLTGGPLSYITSDDIATVAAATSGGALGATPTWTAEKQLATSTGTQGIYHKVHSNGVDRIDLAMTDAVGPTAGVKNDVRHAYWQSGSWRTSAGVSLGDGSTPPGFTAFTAIATSAAPDSFGDMWIHHIQRRSNGVIEVVFYRFISTSDHRCYYARWDGTAWSKSEIDAGYGMGVPDTRSTQITDGQGASEGYYSPGAFFDTTEEGVLYISVGTATYSQVYRYETADEGATWTRQRVSNLAGENVRPVVPVNRAEKYGVLWMSGAYHHYDFNTNPAASDIGYTTQIKSASRNYSVVSVAPANTVAPSIAGSTGTEGNVLTAALGTWTGDMPMTFAYQWIKGGVNISGATSSSYTILSGDVGSTITVRITATNSVNSVSATSAAASSLPTNLVSNSEAFNLWTATGVTTTANIDGTADRGTETSNTSQHILTSGNMNFTAGVTYTFSCRMAYETAPYVQLLFGSAAFGSNAWANFDTQTGVATGTKGSAATVSVIDEGDGSFRLVATATATGTAAAPVAIFFANSATMTRAASYAGNIANTRKLINAQVESGATANTYVPT